MFVELPPSAVPISPPIFRRLNGPLGCLYLLWYGGPNSLSPYTPSLEHDAHGALYLATGNSQPGDMGVTRCVYVPILHDEARAIAAGTLAPRAVLAGRAAVVVDRQFRYAKVVGSWTCSAETMFPAAPAPGVKLTQGTWTAEQVATLEELLCDLGGHAPIGAGQCRCGWRGDEER